MKDSVVNEVMEMVDTFLSLVTIDLEDELDRELAAAYIFGMLNGTAQKESLTPEDVQTLMFNIGIDKLTYSEEVAYQMTQFVIDATDEEFHPTVNAIIHRGLEGYFLYSDQEFDALSEDFNEVVQVVKGEL